MKVFFKIGYAPAMLAIFMIAPMAHAATSPSLGTADSFSVLANTTITNVPTSAISGDVGLDTAGSNYGAGLTSSQVAGTIYDTNGTGPDGAPGMNPGLMTTARNASNAAFTALNAGDNADANCIGGIYADNTDLSTLSPLGPGVYCSAGSFRITGSLVLTGTTGVWVFKTGTTLITSPGSSVTGGDPCNIWWRVGSSATIDTTTAFRGNILASTAVTINSNATLNGRAFAYTAAVTLQANTISGPTCTVPVPPAQPQGGNNPSPLINVKKVPSPLSLPNGPGPVTYSYTVTNPINVVLSNVTLVDDKCSNMKFVSGDTNNNSWLESNETWMYTCTTNLSQTTVNFATARGIGNGLAAVDTAIAEVIVGVAVVPPLIHIVKTPSPLTLPNNGGSVTYGYVVTNPGTVALTNVTVTDNKCPAVSYVSGDANDDSKLQANETWHYTCTIQIPTTTTNTAVATGHANGLTAIDTALATVVVAGAPVPPLIHIIKKADPVILPAAGGEVAYTYSVMNPGTVPLSNVSVVDDTCSPVMSVSGDINGNQLMETSEIWAYTCRKQVSATITNTAMATGHANGLTVTDTSLANVVVSPALIPPAPKLPNTGFSPLDGMATWMVVSAGILVLGTLLFALTQRKRVS